MLICAESRFKRFFSKLEIAPALAVARAEGQPFTVLESSCAGQSESLSLSLSLALSRCLARSLS